MELIVTSQSNLMNNGQPTSKFISIIIFDRKSIRNGIQQAIDDYVAAQYRDGTARACLCFNQDGNLQIDISCINLKLEACWGGEWQA